MVLCTLVCYGLCYSQLQLNEEWFSWKREHAKVYSMSDEGPKWAVWRENYQKIQEHNKANHSFSLALNEFADMVRIKGVLHVETSYRKLACNACMLSILHQQKL